MGGLCTLRVNAEKCTLVFRFRIDRNSWDQVSNNLNFLRKDINEPAAGQVLVESEKGLKKSLGKIWQEAND